MFKTADIQGVAPIDSPSVEYQCTVEVTRPQPYFTSRTSSDAGSWTTPTAKADNYSTESGIAEKSNSSSQNLEPTGDLESAVSAASTSSLATASVALEYANYSTYSSSSDAYAYGGAGYTGYYNAYQQQPSQSYAQQPTSHLYTQQQPSHSNMQHQPNHSFTPHQESSHSYLQQQPTYSYTQPVGAYQNTGAPYQPLSSFQNSGSYAGTTSYSTTYYNPGDYQTSGGYVSNGYNQTASWTDGNYFNYDAQQLASVCSSAASGYSTGAVATNATHNQNHYKQWEDYYSQTEVTCAPGTEHLSVSSSSSQGNSVSGYTTTNIYPSSYTQVWKPESNSYEMPAQPAIGNPSSHSNYWNNGASNIQHNHAGSTGSQFPMSSESKASYDSFQEQQMNVQVPSSQYPTSHQVLSGHQLPTQSYSSFDSRRVSKLQIPTNPRIAPNLTFGAPTKADKDVTTTAALHKPAYVSVSMPTPRERSHPADSVVKPEAFPISLRDYVNRAFKRCTDESQRAACQTIMKEIITKASADGTLCTRDWDTEPLFPLPEHNSEIKDHSQSSITVSSFPISKRSPSKRSKSRWEPITELKDTETTTCLGRDTRYDGFWGKKTYFGKPGSTLDVPSGNKFSLTDDKSVKRQRLTDGSSANDNGDVSSDSDKEQSLTAYHPSALALATNPEEKRRRESRSKRFEKGNGNRSDVNLAKFKNVPGANFHSRRISAVAHSNSAGGAVEDIDWDSLTVKGTCQEIEKRYLRLTSAPDPSTVRPEEILVKALGMVQSSEKNYLYKCDQLKSIRQDLTVQRIRGPLTVKVYETHARLALENGDLPEYNQCQSQLKSLYAEGIEGCHMEFAAYNLLCVILHSNNRRDLLSAMSRLTIEAKADEAVKHALAVRAAVTSENYVMFFKLYKSAPNLNSCLLDLFVEKMRYKAATCISRSYRPTVPVSYIAQVLGFSKTHEEGKDSDALGECLEWLKSHGAVVTDINGEMLLDIKASSSSLYMPEPDDAVAHGDANLAVNDFFTRSS